MVLLGGGSFISCSISSSSSGSRSTSSKQRRTRFRSSSAVRGLARRSGRLSSTVASQISEAERVVWVKWMPPHGVQNRPLRPVVITVMLPRVCCEMMLYAASAVSRLKLFSSSGRRINATRSRR